jgi:hypothetical protein
MHKDSPQEPRDCNATRKVALCGSVRIDRCNGLESESGNENDHSVNWSSADLKIMTDRLRKTNVLVQTFAGSVSAFTPNASKAVLKTKDVAQPW